MPNRAGRRKYSGLYTLEAYKPWHLTLTAKRLWETHYIPFSQFSELANQTRRIYAKIHIENQSFSNLSTIDNTNSQ